ncbi:MAG: UDP-N-acetylglucosamine 2-epimerase [Betaproteobacteria bacterium]
MSGKKKRILIILVDRANYGRMKPIMDALSEDNTVEMLTICAGSMVLERFQRTVDVVRDDGFHVHSEVFMELEGSLPVTMAKSLGFGVVEFSSELNRLSPDLVVLIGDRYEALAAALAAVYQNICVAHIQGGEVSGSIDESARHAISKLAHYHFPSTSESRQNLIRMGESPNTVFNYGCPVGDVIFSMQSNSKRDLSGYYGLSSFDISEPFFLVIFHPVTTGFGEESQQIDAVLEVLAFFQIQSVMLWPNIDAGASHIGKRIRTFQKNHDANYLKMITNLAPSDFQYLLGKTACAIGNSSSFVRDTSFWGTPVVLLGDRQNGREAAENVTRVPIDFDKIVGAVEQQLRHGRYLPSTLYGKGDSGKKIAKKLVELEPYKQKRLHVADDND